MLVLKEMSIEDTWSHCVMINYKLSYMSLLAEGACILSVYSLDFFLPVLSQCRHSLTDLLFSFGRTWHMGSFRNRGFLRRNDAKAPLQFIYFSGGLRAMREAFSSEHDFFKGDDSTAKFSNEVLAGYDSVKFGELMALHSKLFFSKGTDCSGLIGVVNKSLFPSDDGGVTFITKEGLVWTMESFFPGDGSSTINF